MAALLVVDDDPDVSWMLSEMLEMHGHTVRIAHNGLEALRCMAERRPDVVVLDVEMPVLDGPATADRMFVHNLGMENVPIVLVSGVFNLDAVARRVGTPYRIGKPFDMVKLLALLDRALLERVLPRPDDHHTKPVGA